MPGRGSIGIQYTPNHQTSWTWKRLGLNASGLVWTGTRLLGEILDHDFEVPINRLIVTLLPDLIDPPPDSYVTRSRTVRLVSFIVVQAP
jgi:hypothetical protein